MILIEHKEHKEHKELEEGKAVIIRRFWGEQIVGEMADAISISV